MKARATLALSGDLFEPEGSASIDIAKGLEGYAFAWKAVDSAGAEIAQGAKSLAFSSMADPSKPKPYLEQYVSTHIQKTVLKRKNRIKVTGWTWL